MNFATETRYTCLTLDECIIKLIKVGSSFLKLFHGIGLCWNCFGSRWPYVVDYLHKHNYVPILIYIFCCHHEFSLSVQFNVVDNLDLLQNTLLQD
jgi:hypothetical protein